jgi:hypothetical protein
MRTTFLVGRLTPKSTEMVVVKGSRRQNPFPGPWTLRAMVRPRSSDAAEIPTNSTVH